MKIDIEKGGWLLMTENSGETQYKHRIERWRQEASFSAGCERWSKASSSKKKAI